MGVVINVKNMVCQRCILVVNQILEKLDLEVQSISLGEVLLRQPKLTPEQIEELDQLLIQYGFERISDEKGRLLESLKTLIISTIHHEEKLNLNINWSDFLADKLNKDYSTLSSLFSSIEGITLEQYIIRQKIEKVKEYLIYNQLSLKEIAYKLGYSSVAHLSAQFKKQTGFTPSKFREMNPGTARHTLDHIQ